MKVSSDQFVSVFVTVKDIFPELQDDYDTLRILLSGIDRNSALVACAQINFELSDHKTHREERNLTPEQRPMCSQRKLVPLFFTQAEMERLNAFRERRQSTEPIIFFREQVLELIRWIVLICRDEPGREIGFLNSAELNRFTKALLIAGSLWSRRVYRDDLIAARDKSSRAESLETVIRAFRNATTFRPNPMTGVCRGCQLLREIRAIDVTFEEMFERKTDLNLDDYNLAIFCHFLPHFSPLFASRLVRSAARRHTAQKRNPRYRTRTDAFFGVSITNGRSPTNGALGKQIRTDDGGPGLFRSASSDGKTHFACSTRPTYDFGRCIFCSAGNFRSVV